MTQAAVGELIGKSQVYVAERLVLLRLPGEVQEAVIARAIGPSVARRIAAVEDPREQLDLARRAAGGALTVKDVEAAKARLKQRSPEGYEQVRHGEADLGEADPAGPPGGGDRASCPNGNLKQSGMPELSPRRMAEAEDD